MSLSTLFETQVKIGISDADFKKGIAAAGTAVKDFATMGAQAIGNFTKSLVSGVSELAQYGDHIDKQSQKMNMSAQAYQEWDAIMQHSGTTIDSMQMSMKTLANAAESGNDAFELLGMSLEDVQQMSSEELFKATITALQNVESDTQRTYIAGQLLGRGATELGALLNTSAEDTEKMRQRVHELGGVMSDDAVKASAKFQDSLQDMKTAMSGLTRGLKAEFLPSFTDVMDGLTMILAGEEGGENKLEKGIANAMTTLSRSAEKIKPIISKLGDAAFDALKENIPRIVIRGSRLVGEIAVEIIKNLPDILSQTGSLLSDVGNEIGGAFLKLLPDWLGDDIKSIFGSVDSFVKSIDFGKLKSSLSGLGESLEPLVQKLSGGIAWAFENVLKPLGTWIVNDAIPLGIDLISAALDNINNVLDILAPIAQPIWDNFLSPLFSAVGDLAVGSLDILANSLKTIGEAFKDFDSAGFLEDIMNGNFFEDWKIGMGVIGDTLETFGADIDDFFKGPGEKWNQLWQNFGGVVFELKEDLVAAFEAIKRGIEGIGEAIDKHNSFWGSLGEKAYDKIHGIDSNADGGYVSTPRLSWVAEKEPEYIIPESKMDKVFNRNSGDVIININVEGGISSDYDVERLASKLAELNVLQTRAIGGTSF
jgi:phage-related protein